MTKEKLIDGLITAGAVALVGTGLAYGAKQIIRSIKAKSLDAADVQLATRIYNAFTPWASWLKWVDGTNLNALKLAISEITDLDKVAKTYKILFGNELLDDINSEVKGSDLAEVLELLAKARKGGSSTTPSTVKVTGTTAKYVITKGDTNVRKTPVYTPSSLPFVTKNVITLAPKGAYLGVLTGNQKRWTNSKNVTGYPTEIWFVEVRNIKSDLLIWVAASQIEQKTIQQIQALMPDQFVISKKDFDNTASPLSGPLPSIVFAHKDTTVYYPNGEPVKQVAKGTKLGSQIMTIEHGDKGIVQFLTAQNQVRVIQLNAAMLSK